MWYTRIHTNKIASTDTGNYAHTHTHVQGLELDVFPGVGEGNQKCPDFFFQNCRPKSIIDNLEKTIEQKKDKKIKVHQLSTITD